LLINSAEEAEQDKQDRKRHDMQDTKIDHPAHHAACDPAYPVFFSGRRFRLSMNRANFSQNLSGRSITPTPKNVKIAGLLKNFS
jgi:hypothetical protein